MPVHHRLRFLTFPMRTSRLCSLWPDMRPLRFRRVPFGRDGTFDPGGETASRIAMPHILPSTVPSVSASATFFLSWLNPPPHPITVYASHPPSPTTAQHSLPGGALPPYRGRSFTGWNASASPDAPEPEVRIHLPPSASHVRTHSLQICIARRLHPDWRDRFPLDVRPLQSARAALLVLLLARTVARYHSLYPVRLDQPVDLLDPLRPLLGGDRSSNLCSDQPAIRTPRHASHHL